MASQSNLQFRISDLKWAFVRFRNVSLPDYCWIFLIACGILYAFMGKGMTSTPAVHFSHIGIFVSDIARMERFYTKFLGFLVSDSGNLGAIPMVFLSRNPYEHHQIVLVQGRPPEAAFSVINQISLRVEDLAALRHFHANAETHGATDVQAVTHGNAISVYFRDPEGNRVEVFIDTPWYVQQPLRQPIDLSLPDEELWRWSEAHARNLPGFCPVADWRQQLQTRLTRKEEL